MKSRSIILISLIIVSFLTLTSFAEDKAEAKAAKVKEAVKQVKVPGREKAEAKAVKVKEAIKATGLQERKVDEVAVTVNGEKIMESQIDEMIKPQLARMASQTANIPPAFVDSLKQRMRQQAVDKIVMEKLVDAEVAKA
ncbi:MAG: SurA N-terminal domain-containing protein, partial [Planctomycetes bacterium]|nr:SurA N-terminal domain-containing protein [Planctomycetota bacterium]